MGLLFLIAHVGSYGIVLVVLFYDYDYDYCRCQNRRISGRGSRTVRLRRMVTRGRGHDVYPGSGPLDGVIPYVLLDCS